MISEKQRELNMDAKNKKCYRCGILCYGYLCNECRKKKGYRVTQMRSYKNEQRKN